MQLQVFTHFQGHPWCVYIKQSAPLQFSVLHMWRLKFVLYVYTLFFWRKQKLFYLPLRLRWTNLLGVQKFASAYCSSSFFVKTISHLISNFFGTPNFILYAYPSSKSMVGITSWLLANHSFGTQHILLCIKQLQQFLMD
jgi:hypothetical protein